MLHGDVHGLERRRERHLAAANGFDAFISTDKGLAHEQDQAALPVAVVVLLAKDNKLKTIRALVPTLVRALGASAPKRLVTVEAPR